MFPSSSPSPSQVLTPCSRPRGSWPVLEDGRWKRGEFIHFIPSPLETALVCSTCSRYQHPSVRRHWAQLECTEAAVDKGTYSALQRWRLRSAHGSRIPGSTSETPWSQQPLSVSSAFTWLPSSPGSPHMCWWQSWNHRGDSSEEAVQCLWGCACNKEFPWRPVCKRDR